MEKKRIVSIVGALAGCFLLVQAHAGVPEGRALLFNNGNPTMEGLANAHAQFQAAVQSNSDDAEANFFLAATRLMMLTSNGAAYTPGAPVENLRELLDGLGVTTAGRDIFNWTAQPPQDTLPLNAPAGPDLQNVFTASVIPQIDAALANLDKVGSGFVTIITAAEAGSAQNTEVDFGDVLMGKAALYVLRVMVQFLASYDLYADTHLLSAKQDIHLNRDLLAIYPEMLRLLSGGAGTMSQARADFINAVDAYQAASAFIRGETDAQADDFTIIEAEDLEEESHLRVQLAEAKASLQQQRVAAIQQDVGSPTDHIDLNRFFGAPSLTPVDLRSLMPYFDLEANVIAGTFPDTTLGGILPDCTSEPALVDFTGLTNIVFPIHQRTIAIDGVEADWQGIPAIPRSYFSNVGSPWWQAPYDVNYVKVARDQTYWYWMVSLSAAVAPADFNFYLRSPVNNAYLSAQRSNWYCPPGGSCMSNGPYYYYGWWQTNMPYSTMLANLSDVAVGNVIEGKIPLWLLDLEGPLAMGFYSQSVNQIFDSEILTLENVPMVDIGPNLMAADGVTLSGRSVFAANPIQSWQWSLKHRANPAYNRTVSGASPSLTGLAPGLYDVILNATDAGGQTHTATTLLSATGTAQAFTQTDLDQAVQNERSRWDVGTDNVLGIPEAIRALQTVSGLRP